MWLNSQLKKYFYSKMKAKEQQQSNIFVFLQVKCIEIFFCFGIICFICLKFGGDKFWKWDSELNWALILRKLIKGNAIILHFSFLILATISADYKVIRFSNSILFANK